MKKPGKNKYVKRAHISERKFKEIIKGFSLDLTAEDRAQLSNISRNTINKFYKKIRERIVSLSQENIPFSGEVEIDESYFGAKRVRGKRGRGAAGKTPVFGVLKREGKVFVQVVKKCSEEELMPIIQGKF